MRRPAVARGLSLLAAASLALGAAVAGGVDRPAPSVADPVAPAVPSSVAWNGSGQAPCPEGQTRVAQAMGDGFGDLPQPAFNRGFYLVDSAFAGRAARSLLPADGSRTRNHLFLDWTRVTPGARTMLGFATRGSTPGGYYATVDVNSRSVQVTVGSTAWSGRVYDVTSATDDEGGNLGTWFEHRAVTGQRTWWDLDNVQVYTCRTAPVSRVEGVDRYATSARISSRFDPGVPVAYLASGTGFPDGISASAPAAAADSPVLLVPHASIPSSVRTELTRLQPARIVVVGGSAAIDDTVLEQARSYATTGEVTRVDGVNRYDTSALLAAQFPVGGPVAFVATGEAYPDALTGSALAGHRDAPLVLTRRDVLPPEVRAALTDLAPGSIIVLGGAGSVSDQVLAELRQLATSGSVSRIAGVDRYDTAARVAAGFPTTVPRVYVASGANFPDALAGSALAGSQGVPLLLAAPTWVPTPTLARLDAMNAASAVLLGGAGALHPIVMDRVGGRVG